jgi:hypothetical protein
MVDWLKRRLQAIEGNAVWAFLAFLGAYLLTLLPIAAIKNWAHRPVSNLGMLLWSLLPVCIVLIVILIRSRTKPKMKIQVHPTGGRGSSIFLTVTNLGKATTFSAFCSIVGHPNGANDFRRGEFRCGWEDGRVDRILIQKGEAANLLIAKFHDAGMPSLLRLTLWEVINGDSVPTESSSWNQLPSEALPGFEIKVRIVGEKTREPKVFDYTVRPSRYTGPLEMVQSEVSS